MGYSSLPKWWGISILACEQGPGGGGGGVGYIFNREKGGFSYFCLEEDLCHFFMGKSGIFLFLPRREGGIPFYT